MMAWRAFGTLTEACILFPCKGTKGFHWELNKMIYTFITQLSIENGDQMLSLNIFSRKLGEKKRGITKFLLNFLPKLLGGSSTLTRNSICKVKNSIHYCVAPPPKLNFSFMIQFNP